MKILLIGPLPPPITGNSIINNQIINNFHKYYQDINMDFINVGVPSFDNHFGKINITKLAIYVSQYKSIYKVFTTNIVYISIGHTFFGILKYLPFFILAKILRKKLIIHVHTDYLWLLYKNSSATRKYIMRSIMGLVDKGIVLSPILRRNLQPFMEESKIYELPNFISSDLLKHDIDETLLKKKNQKLKILFLSNLIKEKGILNFLEAMLLLKKENIDFEVHIAGDIPSFMKDEIESYFKLLGSLLIFHGVVSGQAKKDLFISSNIFLFPTHREAQGLVLLEAMATGNIILSTAAGGIPDIFKPNVNGFTIEVNNPINIVDTVLQVKKMKPNDLKNILINNYNEVKKKYTEESFFNNLYKIVMDTKD